MDAAEQAEIWRMLDRASLSQVVASGPCLLFATISGAHLYGFASPDSDVDLRGAFVRPARELLGLSRPKETISRTLDVAGVEVDWVAHDIGKFARMMTQHNGYVLEQLYSPLVLAGGGRLEELRAIGKGCITRRLLRHYRGFAHGRRRLLDQPGATVKHLLYAYRVYLSGIHALQTGEIQAHLPTLNRRFESVVVTELVDRKRAGGEKQLLAPGEAAEHAARLDALEAELVRAAEASQLPDLPTTLEELDAFVVDARLSA
jgi:predicted nucleotidyltransferase